MELQEKEIIKNYLLDEKIPVEERKERFKIAWDIYTYFDEIRKEIALSRVFLPLKKKVESIMPSSFVVSNFDFGSIYITKQSWKEHQKDKGIVAVAIERWFEDATRVGIVKSRNFTLESERVVRDELSKEGLYSSTARWLGYLPNLSGVFSSPLLEYYNYILENPDRVINEHFEALNRVLEIVKKEKIQNLLDEFVEEMKSQVSHEA
jgi:hypothetical protein